MRDPGLTELAADLAHPERRPEAARRLAEALGVSWLIVFSADPELGTMLPGPGFPQCLPGGRRWRALVADALAHERAEGTVLFDDVQHEARAWSTPDGTVLVLLGVPRHDLRPVLELLPLLGALFRAERSALLARREAAAAQESARESQALARGLEAARSQVQSTMRELRGARDAAEAANRSKSLFLANMSHELRTPLHGILGMVELLAAGELAPEQRADLDVIRSACGGLLSIIDDILDFSRIEARRVELEKTTFDLEPLLRNVAAVHRKAAADRGLTLDFRTAARPPAAVVGDPHRLAQVLHNLLSNAVKFTHEGSVELVLTDCRRDGERIRVGLEVRDTGIGIAREVLPHLFEPFRQADSSTTRRYGGSGLGLSISRELVRLMGGDLAVQSEEGVGSCFRMEVPLLQGPVEGPLPGALPDTFAGTSLRVLVAEDNPVNRQVMRRLLERNGHEVLLACDGQEAVEMWEREALDLVLMDVQMPRMDGLEAMRRIREREAALGRARTSLAALTAGASVQDRDACYAAGADHYVPKPVPPGELERVLHLAQKRVAGHS